ncbi:hypothetical protein AVEN_249354-1 [Araneus ventricosus]|uniref:Uncharacterized protein n=1 Tax=Araneus ventricosus TaxID=182803 RepID=A0A4Y2JP05_ARAVE|nr:hypothetical protein AVEN_249354-1 [Araneus ventricosus]
MKSTIPEPAPISPNFRTKPTRGFLNLNRFNAHQVRIHSISSVRTGLELVTLRLRSRTSVTKPSPRFWIPRVAGFQRNPSLTPNAQPVVHVPLGIREGPFGGTQHQSC